jgi:hypothetical protein
MAKKKSASSPDEAALLGKKYHIAAKVITFVELGKFFLSFFLSFYEKMV